LTLGLAWFASDRSLASEKREILAQQKSAIATVGTEWFPLRDRLERLTLDAAAAGFAGDNVDVELAKVDFRSVPGLYLRLRVADARSLESLRTHAQDSVKDAFTGCLLREPNAALGRGDADAGIAPEQPWNLKAAYAATRVFSEEWTREVSEASDKDRLRVFRQQYDKAKRDQIPTAIEIVKRAQFFLLVLDEDVPEAAALAGDAGVTQDVLQQLPHPARVHIVNLKTGAEIARLRRTGSAEVLSGSESAVRDPDVRAAMKRQVNNCALAQDVWSALRGGQKEAARGGPR
jgi:hypothetical protein